MFSAPSPILRVHETAGFACGHEPLDAWLRTRALVSEGRTARTFVVCEDNAVVGYYCLATGAVRRGDAPGNLRRNSPDPVPVLLIGRLAVAKRCERKGIGAGLLQDALRRVVQATTVVGAAALVVHAIDDDAGSFYRKFGFLDFADGTRTLYLPIETIRAAV